MKSKEKKLTLFLLCWIFGLLAIHRFYTGKYLTGGLQLLVLSFVGAFMYFEVESLRPFAIFVAGSLLLWWIIDFVRIIMGKFTDREGNRITEWI